MKMPYESSYLSEMENVDVKKEMIKKAKLLTLHLIIFGVFLVLWIILYDLSYNSSGCQEPGSCRDTHRARFCFGVFSTIVGITMILAPYTRQYLKFRYYVTSTKTKLILVNLFFVLPLVVLLIVSASITIYP